ncbi:MAG: M3 family oligoendopeptidase, partial [Pseudolabrys sp.]
MARASAKRAVKTATSAPARGKSAPKVAAKKATAKTRGPSLGDLPGWNLADLYPGIDSPELKRDLDHVAAECVAFE